MGDGIRLWGGVMAENQYRRSGYLVSAGGTHRTCEVWECDGCGALIEDRMKETHSRFHSVLSSHGWALAVLKTHHIASHVHDKYDVVERIDSKKFDNWSADAFAEVIADLDEDDSR